MASSTSDNGLLQMKAKCSMFTKELSEIRLIFEKSLAEETFAAKSIKLEKPSTAISSRPHTAAAAGKLSTMIKENEKRFGLEAAAAKRRRLLIDMFDKSCLKYRDVIPLNEFISNQLDFADSLCYRMEAFDMVDALCYSPILQLVDDWLQDWSERYSASNSSLIKTSKGSKIGKLNITESEPPSAVQSRQNLHSSTTAIMGRRQDGEFTAFSYLKNRVEIGRIYCDLRRLLAQNTTESQGSQGSFLNMLDRLFRDFLAKVQNLMLLQRPAQGEVIQALGYYQTLLDSLLVKGLYETAIPLLHDTFAILDSSYLTSSPTLANSVIDMKVSLAIRISQAFLMKGDFDSGLEFGEAVLGWLQTGRVRDQNHPSSVTFTSFMKKVRSVFSLLKGDHEKNQAGLEKRYQKEVTDNASAADKRAAANKKQHPRRKQANHEKDPGMEDVIKSHYQECARLFLYFHFDENLRASLPESVDPNLILSVIAMTLEALTLPCNGLQSIGKPVTDYDKKERMSLALLQIAWNMIANQTVNTYENYKGKTEGFTPFDDIQTSTPKISFSPLLLQNMKPNEVLSIIRKLYYFEDTIRCSLLLDKFIESYGSKYSSALLLQRIVACKLASSGRHAYSESLAQDNLLHAHHNLSNQLHDTLPDNSEESKSEKRSKFNENLGSLVSMIALSRDLSYWNDSDLLSDSIGFIWKNYEFLIIESPISGSEDHSKMVSFGPNQIVIQLKSLIMLHYTLLLKCPAADPVIVHDMTVEVARILKARNRNIEAAECIRGAIDFLSRVYTQNQAGISAELAKNENQDAINLKRQKIDELAFIIARFTSIWHSSLLSLGSKADRNFAAIEEEKSKTFHRKVVKGSESLESHVFNHLIQTYRSNDYGKALLMLDVCKIHTSDDAGGIEAAKAAINEAHRFVKLAMVKEQANSVADQSPDSENWPAPKVVRNGKDFAVLQLSASLFLGNSPVEWVSVHCKEASQSAVSLKDSHYPGCGIRMRCNQFLEYPVSGLSCNQEYQFAFSYYDQQGQLLAMGKSCKPFLLSLGPTSNSALWAYFAELCYNNQLQDLHGTIVKRWKSRMFEFEIASEAILYQQVSRGVAYDSLPELFLWNMNEVSTCSRLNLQSFMRTLLNEADMFLAELEPMLNDLDGRRNVYRQTPKALRTLLTLQEVLDLASFIQDFSAQTLAITKIFQISLPLMQGKGDPFRVLLDAVLSATSKLQQLIRVKGSEQKHLPGALRYFIPCSYWTCLAIGRVTNPAHESSVSRLAKYGNAALDILTLLHPSEADEDESLRSYSIDNLLEFSTRKTLTVVERTRRTQYEEAVFHVLKATLESGRYGTYAKDLSVVVMLKEHIKKVCYDHGINVGALALAPKAGGNFDKAAAIDNNSNSVSHQASKTLNNLNSAALDHSNSATSFVSSVLELFQVFRTHGSFEAFKRLSKLKVHPRYVELCCRLAEECYQAQEYAYAISICSQILDWLETRNDATLNPYLVGLADETEVVEVSHKNTFFARKKRRIAIKNKKHNLEKASLKFKSAGSIDEDKIVINEQQSPSKEATGSKTQNQDSNIAAAAAGEIEAETIAEPDQRQSKSDNASEMKSVANSSPKQGSRKPSSRATSPSRAVAEANQKAQPEKDVDWARRTLRRLLPEFWSEKRYRLRLRDMLEIEAPYRSRICFILALSILKESMRESSSKFRPEASSFAIMDWSNFLAFENCIFVSNCLNSNATDSVPKLKLNQLSLNNKNENDKTGTAILSLSASQKLVYCAVAYAQAAVLAVRSHAWRQLIDISMHVQRSHYELARRGHSFPKQEGSNMFYACAMGLLDFLDTNVMVALNFESHSENYSNVCLDHLRQPNDVSLKTHDHAYEHLSPNQTTGSSSSVFLLENSFGIINDSTAIVDVSRIYQFLCFSIGYLMVQKKPQKAVELIDRFSRKTRGALFDKLHSMKDSILGTNLKPEVVLASAEFDQRIIPATAVSTKMHNFTSHGAPKKSNTSFGLVEIHNQIQKTMESHQALEYEQIKDQAVKENVTLLNVKTQESEKSDSLGRLPTSVESTIIEYKRLIEAIGNMEDEGEFQFIKASAYLSCGDLYFGQGDEKRALACWAKMLDTSFGYPEVIPNWKRYIQALTAKGTPWLVIKHLDGLSNSIRSIACLCKISVHCYHHDLDKRQELVYFAYEMICGIMSKTVSGPSNQLHYTRESCHKALETLFRGVDLFVNEINFSSTYGNYHRNHKTNHSNGSFGLKRPIVLIIYLDFLVRQLLAYNDPIPALVVLNLKLFIICKYCNSEEVLANFYSLRIKAYLALNAPGRALADFQSLLSASKLSLDRIGFESVDIGNRASVFEDGESLESPRNIEATLQIIETFEAQISKLSGNSTVESSLSLKQLFSYAHLINEISRSVKNSVSLDQGLKTVNSRLPIKSCLTAMDNSATPPEDQQAKETQEKVLVIQDLMKSARKSLEKAFSICEEGSLDRHQSSQSKLIGSLLLAQSYYYEDNLVTALALLDFTFLQLSKLDSESAHAGENSSLVFGVMTLKPMSLIVREFVIPARKLYLKICSKLNLGSQFSKVWEVAMAECKALKANMERLGFQAIYAKHLFRREGSNLEIYLKDLLDSFDPFLERLKYPSCMEVHSSNGTFRGPISFFRLYQKMSALYCLAKIHKSADTELTLSRLLEIKEMEQSYCQKIQAVNQEHLKNEKFLGKIISFIDFMEKKIKNSENFDNLPLSIRQKVIGHILFELEYAAESSTSTERSKSAKSRAAALELVIQEIIGKVETFFERQMQNRIFYNTHLGEILIMTFLRLSSIPEKSSDACKLLYLSEKLFEDLKSSFSAGEIQIGLGTTPVQLDAGFSSILASWIVQSKGLKMSYLELFQKLDDQKLYSKRLQHICDNTVNCVLPTSTKELSLILPAFIKTLSTWDSVVIDSKYYIRQLLVSESCFRTLFPQQCAKKILPGVRDIVSCCKIPEDELFILKWIVPTTATESHMACYILYKTADDVKNSDNVVLVTSMQSREKITRIGMAIQRLLSMAESAVQADKIKLLMLLEKVFKQIEWTILCGSNLLDKVSSMEASIEKVLESPQSLSELQKMVSHSAEINGLFYESKNSIIAKWMLNHVKASLKPSTPIASSSKEQLRTE